MSRLKSHGMISRFEITIHQRRHFSAVHVENFQRHVLTMKKRESDRRWRVAEGSPPERGKWIGIILLQVKPAHDFIMFSNTASEFLCRHTGLQIL